MNTSAPPPRALGFSRAYPVLYVDDEPDNLLVFRTTFRDEFEVITASSGAEAEELLDIVPVAVLLTDQRMPGMSGVTLCERVRAHRPDVIRMLVTAYSDTQVAIAAINQGGVSRYITKPWEAEQVRQVLREAVARAHLERMVRKLRSAILDKERLVGVQAATLRLLHDLATTNASIETCCDNLEALGERLSQRVDPDIFERYSGEVGELRHYVDYVSALREQGAPKDGRASRKPERGLVSIPELVTLVVELARPEQAPTASLHGACPEGLVAFADRTDLSRILLNLVRSAGRALRASGRSDGQIQIAARDEGGTTVITVRDDGPPVEPGTQERLFSLREGEGRHGFELVVARELALTNGGSIELVGGQEDGWTLWQLSVPAHEAEAS